MRNCIICWLGLSLLGVLVGCGKPASQADLAGVYVANYEFATDTLTLKEDGQFIQTIKIKADGRMVTKSSQWHFRPKNQDILIESNYMLVIDGFSKMIPDFDRANPKSVIIGPVRRVFGRLEIGGDDLPWGRIGIEIPYTKQPKP